MKEKNSGGQKHLYREQLITVEDLELFKDELFNKIKDLFMSMSTLPGKKWLKSPDVRKLLGISSGTLQNLRINGVLSYTKIGGVLYYDHEQILKTLSTNHVQNRILQKNEDK